MKEYLLPIIVILIIIIVYLIWENRKVALQNRIKKLAAWTITENSNTYRCNIHLHEYISNEQKNLLEEYRIVDEDDLEMAKEILSSFQKYLNEQLLINSLVMPKTKHVISGEDFFMFHLQFYLEKHQCDDSFIGYDMHEKTISRTNYGSWGGMLYDATYSLTKFAVVFNKLYYISYCYCKNSKSINPDGEYFVNENGIENIIDSKRISISRM